MTTVPVLGRSGGSPGRPGAPCAPSHLSDPSRSAGPSRSARQGRDAGQAAVEVVLVVPVVVLLALLIVQVGQVVHHQLLVAHVAREAARAAAVGDGQLDPDAVPGLRRGLDPRRLTVDVAPDPGTGRVRVQVRYRDPTDVAVVGPLLPDVDLEATVVMRTEG